MNVLCSFDHNLESIKFLVEWKADVNMAEDEGITPLMHLCQSYNNNLDKISYLIDMKADPNQFSTLSENSFTTALWHNKSDEILRKMVESGANVNIINQNGHTALHLLGDNISFYEPKIPLLRDLGANPKIESRSGWNFFDIVKVLDREDLIQLFDQEKYTAVPFEGKDDSRDKIQELAEQKKCTRNFTKKEYGNFLFFFFFSFPSFFFISNLKKLISFEIKFYFYLSLADQVWRECFTCRYRSGIPCVCLSCVGRYNLFFTKK